MSSGPGHRGSMTGWAVPARAFGPFRSQECTTTEEVCERLIHLRAYSATELLWSYGIAESRVALHGSLHSHDASIVA
jgi:hypothetical protein